MLEGKLGKSKCNQFSPLNDYLYVSAAFRYFQLCIRISANVLNIGSLCSFVSLVSLGQVYMNLY